MFALIKSDFLYADAIGCWVSHEGLLEIQSRGMHSASEKGWHLGRSQPYEDVMLSASPEKHLPGV